MLQPLAPVPLTQENETPMSRSVLNLDEEIAESTAKKPEVPKKGKNT
jgi:hypothetical protein